MKTIPIHLGSNSYNVYIGDDALATAGQTIRNLTHAKKAVILTEEGIDRLYGYDVVKIMEKAGLNVQLIAVSSIEKSRSIAMVERVYDALVNFGLGAHDVLIGLGGRIVGDVTGFVAATYRRGIPYFSIPTSVVSQVSSSIGGKITIDIPAGRSLVGTYYQPKGVFIDPSMAKTLPRRYLCNGLGEAVRVGASADAGLFDLLGQIPDVSEAPRYLNDIIERSVTVKARFVEADPYNQGERHKLDFGHTIGNALERYYRFDDLRITHGEAEAIGMAVITKNSERLGFTEKGTYEILRNLLKRLDLPVCVPLSAKDLAPSILQDQNLRDKTIQLTLLKKIGDAELKTVTLDELKEYTADLDKE